MSLSQKHSGKVLVPWFNISEWKLVYNLIYSENSRDWPKALQILKIWKHRTPLLSAGVEGTLIVLEALLVNTSQLSAYESSHIFSTSLVRFLNLCAANSEKQGTFYKTAMQNELPNWLVSIRHDIAHSHKVPSLSMLEMSLKFCLEWLKEKYWGVQGDNMVDFVVEEGDSVVVEDCVFIHSHLNGGEINENNRRLMKRVSKFVGDRGEVSDVIERVDEALRNEFKVNREKSSDKICKLLIDSLRILNTECEEDDSGSKNIPTQFVNKWTNLLNIVLEGEILPNFVTGLFKFTVDSTHSFSHREVASLWIKEIFSGLNKQNSQSGLSFRTQSDCMKNRTFVTEVLEHLSPFTLNFLQEVLEYNEAPTSFIEDSVCLVSAFNTCSRSNGDKIYTIDDLGIIEENLGDDTMEIQPSIQTKSRWVLIEDTSPYMNLPLGILPHQDPNINPLLTV